MAKNKSSNFFESPIWDFIELAGNAIGLNLLFVAACLPIVTIGPACCGLYSAIRYYARKDSWFNGFKKGFKTNFFSMMIIWIVSCAVILFIGNDVLAIIKNYKPEFLTSLIPLSLILALAVAFLSSATVYNVYFPRKMIDLLSESASFVFKAPLWLLLSGVFLWAPLICILAFLSEILPFILVFIAIYFVVIVLVSTMLLKNPLIKVLNEKRASGELPPIEKDEEEI